MRMHYESFPGPVLELFAIAQEAGAQVPPVWPLAATVAVNPYLGQAGEPLALTAARLARTAGAPVTRPRAAYAERIAAGEITDADLRAAIPSSPFPGPATPAALREAAQRPAPAPSPLPTVAELAAEASGIDWPAIVADRIGHWAASHFDAGQALWPAPAVGAFAAWHAFARRDLTPEIHGLAGFCAHVEATPLSANAALARAAERLGYDGQSAPTGFHRLLMTLGGWAQLARQRRFVAERDGGRDSTLTDLLAVRLVWEEALLERYGDAIGTRWAEVRAAHAAPLAPTADQVIDTMLQEAADRAAQRRLAATLAAPARPGGDDRPAVQAAFCIDVRSEILRRALESVGEGVQTIGFAGFFGLPVRHRAHASDVEEDRLPVLLRPAIETRAEADEAADRATRLRRRAVRAWGRFKLAAVSSFAFVEAAGPLYAAKLVRDALGHAHGAGAEPAPQLDPALPLEARVDAAQAVLRAMSLTEGFGRIVMLSGHGARVVNNPHASALQCGACGGHAGDVSARLLARLLNDPDLRRGLAARGIAVPEDTLFLAALHDTVTDEVTLFEADVATGAHREDIVRLRRWLDEAARLARSERAVRLPRAAGEGDLAARASDWSEVRPEWGLAGCSAFIAAPRERTAGRDLGGRSFLHSYDWKADEGFSTLELILTAPVVVASWISLQYYGSAVAPDTFGAGNKLLHNVTGGIGVVEGNGGTLRAGLPWQSVHDGERFMHEPLRLSVCIEAPREAISEILSRHAQVRALFDNGWLALFAMDEAGGLAWRYEGDLRWAPAFGRGLRAVAAE